MYVTGAEGRTRTGTTFRTADFEFLQGVFRQFAIKLTTSLKVADFIGSKAFFYAGFRPILPHLVFDVGSQKVVNTFSN